MPKILAFSGSARAASLNKRLVHAAVLALRDAGAEVTEIDLGDFKMPLYDGDDEERDGQPEAVERLREVMREHDGLLVGCPEYNGLITPLLKNTIDWVSRPDASGNSGLAVLRGKVAALTAASPGGLGGLRGLPHVQTLLSNIGMLVLPGALAVSKAHQAFDDEGLLKDSSAQKRLAALATALVDAAQRLRK